MYVAAILSEINLLTELSSYLKNAFRQNFESLKAAVMLLNVVKCWEMNGIAGYPRMDGVQGPEKYKIHKL